MPYKENSVASTSKRVLATDFCRYFLEESRGLYLLALMLTADRKLAEECLTKAFDDCLRVTGVFKGWERTWARRSIIRNAIDALGGTLRESSPAEHRASPGGPVELNAPDGIDHEDSRLAGVMALGPFERFVFVLSVLESYSDHECRILLRSSKQEIINARVRALQALAESAADDDAPDVQIGQSRTQYDNIEVSAMSRRFTKDVEALAATHR